MSTYQNMARAARRLSALPGVTSARAEALGGNIDGVTVTLDNGLEVSISDALELAAVPGFLVAVQDEDETHAPDIDSLVAFVAAVASRSAEASDMRSVAMRAAHSTAKANGHTPDRWTLEGGKPTAVCACGGYAAIVNVGRGEYGYATGRLPIPNSRRFDQSCSRQQAS